MEAADHLDPPTRTNPDSGGTDREADIADVYAWHDTDSVTLVLTFDGPNAPDVAMPCPRDVLYTLHIDNDGVALDPAMADTFDDEFTIDTRFGLDDAGNCMVSVSGLPGVPAGAAVSGLVGYPLQRGSTVRAFAGLRDDAFFFDLQGFRTITAATAPTGRLIQRDSAGVIMRDTDGNPILNFVNDRDFFAGLNTPAIVVEFPLLAVSPTNQVFRVWASTARIPAT